MNGVSGDVGVKREVRDSFERDESKTSPGGQCCRRDVGFVSKRS